MNLIFIKDHIETIGNPLGLCAVSSKLENNVIAVPGLLKGHLHIELYTKVGRTMFNILFIYNYFYIYYRV